MSRNLIRLKFIFLDGNTHEITCFREAKISTIKDIVSEITGKSTNEFELIGERKSGGRVGLFPYNRLLSRLGIEDGDTITVARVTFE